MSDPGAPRAQSGPSAGRAGRRTLAFGLAWLVWGALWPASAPAQITCLIARCIDVSSSTVVLPVATVSDFDAGQITGSTGTTFTVTANFLTQSQVLIRAMSPSLGVYGKPVGHLEWRRADQGTWNAMTTADRFVQSGTGSFSNTVYYRITLAWAEDVPGTYGATIRYTVAPP